MTVLGITSEDHPPVADNSVSVAGSSGATDGPIFTGATMTEMHKFSEWNDSVKDCPEYVTVAWPETFGKKRMPCPQCKSTKPTKTHDTYIPHYPSVGQSQYCWRLQCRVCRYIWTHAVRS